jgi:DNA-binding PadR family transcriptional regulator
VRVPPTRRDLSEGPLSTQIFLILLALADGDAHGARIRKAVLERSEGAVDIDPGSLYRLIARLLDDALILETDGPPTGDDQRQRLYRLSVNGRRVLQNETERLGRLVAEARARTGCRVRT